MGRNLTIWLLCLGILLLFFFWGRLNPFVSMFTVSLAPLPVYLAGRRLGSPAALLLVLAVSLAIFCWKPGLEVVSENLGFGELLLMGFLLSSLESRGWAVDRAIILTVAGLTLLSLLFLTGEAYLSGMTPREIIAQKTKELTEIVSKALTGGEEVPAGAKIFGVSLEQAQSLIGSLVPALVIINTAMVAWVNVILGRQLLVLLKGDKPEPRLCYWSAPEWLIFPVLALGFLLLAPVLLVRQICMNLLLIAGLLYFLQGLAVIAAWFQRLRLPLLIRCIGYPLLFFLIPLPLVVITLGLMDLWFDFRRLHQPLDA